MVLVINKLECDEVGQGWEIVKRLQFAGVKCEVLQVDA